MNPTHKLLETHWNFHIRLTSFLSPSQHSIKKILFFSFVDKTMIYIKLNSCKTKKNNIDRLDKQN